MRNYRDLQVWEKSHHLTLRIYRLTRTFPLEERFGLTSQIRRSGASIPANLAEGCGRRSDREMRRFVQVAMGSGAELSYHLLLARDLGLISKPDYASLDSELCLVMRMMSRFAAKLREPELPSAERFRLANGQEPGLKQVRNLLTPSHSC